MLVSESALRGGEATWEQAKSASRRWWSALLRIQILVTFLVRYGNYVDMKYQLPDDLKRRLEARLSSRSYESLDDIIRNALDALDELEQDDDAATQKSHSNSDLPKPNSTASPPVFAFLQKPCYCWCFFFAPRAAGIMRLRRLFKGSPFEFG